MLCPIVEHRPQGHRPPLLPERGPPALTRGHQKHRGLSLCGGPLMCGELEEKSLPWDLPGRFTPCPSLWRAQATGRSHAFPDLLLGVSQPRGSCLQFLIDTRGLSGELQGEVWPQS